MYQEVPPATGFVNCVIAPKVPKGSADGEVAASAVASGLRVKFSRVALPLARSGGARDTEVVADLDSLQDDQVSAQARRVRIAGWGVASLSFLALLGSIPLVPASTFLFDAPGSEKNPLLWLFVSAAWAAPVTFSVALTIALRAARSGAWPSLRTAIAWLAGTITALLATGALLYH